MTTGKLIVLEGGDGSGKATQAERLYQALTEKQYRVRKVTFPNYEGDASAPVRMYLAGRFGTRPDDVNAYVASTFYAVDRFASYREDWQDFYVSGGIIIADRYVTSNMVHQMTKCKDESEALRFLAWLDDLEYEKFGLPRPDLVCLLDIPLVQTTNLLHGRVEVKDRHATLQADIHEADGLYLQRCHDAYDLLEKKYNWKRVRCANELGLRSVDDIHQEVLTAVISILNK